MDVLLLVLSVVALLCGFALAFLVYEALKVVICWARARVDSGDLGCRLLVLRLPAPAVSALLVMAFLALVL